MVPAHEASLVAEKGGRNEAVARAPRLELASQVAGSSHAWGTTGHVVGAQLAELSVLQGPGTPGDDVP